MHVTIWFQITQLCFHGIFQLWLSAFRILLGVRKFHTSQRIWEQAVAGSRQYIIDRIGEFEEAGISEVMFDGIA